MFSCVNFRPAKSDKQKGKKDQDQPENSNDARDPSAEQKERLLAVDEEIADEEDQSIAKEEDISRKSQAPLSVQCLRSLVCLDETSKFFYVRVMVSQTICSLRQSNPALRVFLFVCSR